MVKLFGNYPFGYTLLDKIRVTFWRLFECAHDTPMFVDLGDEEHTYWYCFRCCRKI